MERVFNIIKYTIEDGSFFYTFPDFMDGIVQVKLIGKITREYENPKIYLITGCHGAPNGENWEDDGSYRFLNKPTGDMEKRCLKFIKEKCSDAKIYDLKDLKIENFLEKLKQKKGHMIIGYCYSDKDKKFLEFLESVKITKRKSFKMTETKADAENLMREMVRELTREQLVSRCVID